MADLGTLMEDVLLYVFTHLDEPAAFALTCKRFQGVSKLTLWRARWLMQRHLLYEVLFYAISKPKICTAALIDQLIRLGAPLSRNLMQTLYVMRDPILKGNYTNWDEPTINQVHMRWGEISFSAYAAIIKHSERLYGDELPTNVHDFDSFVFAEWLFQIANRMINPFPSEHIQCLFHQRRFMPLPIALLPFGDEAAIGRPTQELSTSLLFYDPSLYAVLIANGFQMDQTRTESMLRSIASFRPREEALNAVDQLDFKEPPPMSLGFVVDAVCSMRQATGSSEYCGTAYRPRLWDPPPPIETLYSMLLKLDRRSALPYHLESLVQELVASVQGGTVSANIISLIERLDQDFPNLAAMPDVFVVAEFFKAEREDVKDLDLVKQMMGRHAVTPSNIMLACLRNGCRSVTPIEYGLKFVNGFEHGLQAFVEELVGLLILQPYRGLMLRELERYCAQSSKSLDVLKLVATAVEKQAFIDLDLPTAQWNRTDGFILCNAVAPVRSMLCYNLVGRNALQVNLCQCQYTNSRAPLTVDRARPPQEVMRCVHARYGAINEPPSPCMKAATQFGGAPTTSLAPEGKGGGFFALREDRALLNFFGPISDDDEPVAEAIVDLLGAQTRAAGVLLSHAIVNSNEPLIDHLLEHAVPLTLMHFRVSLKVGYRLPASMLRSVDEGVPFRLSFDGADDRRDVKQIFSSGIRSKPELTEVERNHCLSLALGRPAVLDVHIDQAGVLHISEPETPRTAPVETVTPTPAQPSQMQPTEVDDDDPSSRFVNTERWLKALRMLMALEVRQNLAIRAVWLCASGETRSWATVQLTEYIDTLPVRLARLRGSASFSDDDDAEAASDTESPGLEPLWEEMREAGDDEAFEHDVKRHVNSALRGFKRTRSQRRAAFKGSRYSYMPTTFRGKCVMTIQYSAQQFIIEPDIAPLSDEDSADEDFSPSMLAEDSGSESTDELESTSSYSGDSSDESRPPSKRARVDRARSQCPCHRCMQLLLQGA